MGRVLILALALLASTVDADDKADKANADKAKGDKAKAEKLWETARARFDDYSTWEALGARTRGAQALARTLDPRAIPLICGRYRNPGDPYPRLEQLLAAGVLQDFAQTQYGAKDVLALTEKDACAWLGLTSCRLRAGQGDAEAVFALARDLKAKPVQRSVAIQALGYNGPEEDVAALLVELLGGKLVRKRTEQQLVLSAVCESLLALGRRTEREVWRAPALALADRLTKRTPRHEAGLIARFLGSLLGVQDRWLEREPWQALIRAESPTSNEVTRTRTQFMGLSTTGERVVYVIDLSDSMLLPLSDEERTVLRPLTESGSRKRKKGKVDWDRQRTRFDAVRECLKLSLRSLNKRTQFAVVGFGNTAEVLAATPRLVQANTKNVALACHELDQINAGTKTTAQKLRGRTNVHAGIRLAFQLTARAPIANDEEHQAPEALKTGCDAIFLLSDGTPTRWDYQGTGPEKEYPAYDIKERDYTYKDPETGEEREVHQEARHVPARTVKQSMGGPYSDRLVFAQDIRRLNVLRKVEINAIGVGEYSKPWLQAITHGGQGQLRLIGDGKPEEKPKVEPTDPK